MNARKRKQRIPAWPDASMMARINQRLADAGQTLLAVKGNEYWGPPRDYTSFCLELQPSGKTSRYFYNTPLTGKLILGELDKMLGA